jgi:phytanoyl-CoA hydroxylase
MTSFATVKPLAPLKANFQKKGYCVVPKLFSLAAVKGCVKEMQGLFNNRLESLGILLDLNVSLETAMKTLLARDQASYIAAAKLTQSLPTLVRMSTEPNLIHVLHEMGLTNPVFSTRQVCHFLGNGLEIPGGYFKTPPHQDWRTTQGSLDSVVVWALMHDEGQNYPLEVIPGSHRLGLMPAQDHPFGHEIVPDQLPSSPFESIDIQPGDALIFSTLLIHRTGERGRRGFRVASSFRFNNADEPTFLTRNYPNPYIYKPQPDLMTEDFPTPQDLEEIFHL